MGDHLALFVDRLITASSLNINSSSFPIPPPPPFSSPFCSSPPLSSPSSPFSSSALPPPSSPSSPFPSCSISSSSASLSSSFPSSLSSLSSSSSSSLVHGNAEAECRICQEEDGIGNLDIPCSCSGSLKYAHHKCVQLWCNEKGDTICEICCQPFKGGYTAPTRPLRTQDIRIEIGGNWDMNADRELGIHDPHILAVAAERHFMGAEYDEYRSNANGVACCRSAALILMVLFLLQHVFSMTNAATTDDITTSFTFFVLRTIGFLLPCYVLVRTMNKLNNRQRQQDAVIAAAEVAMLLQAGGQAHGVRIALSPGPSSSSMSHS